MGRLIDAFEIRKSGLGLGNQHAECVGLGDRQIAQHLAVDSNLSLAEAVDKSAIGQPMVTDGSVDALDPEGAEIALLDATIAVGVLASLFDGLLGDTDRRLAAALIALRSLQYLFMTGVSGNASFNA